MISFDEAYRVVMKSVFETNSEMIPFIDSVGRILDEDIISDIDMPPFNRSAMDGYACHKEDLKTNLEIIEVIAAGKEPVHKVGKDQCSKIMTGAIVPQGCDVVFMVEESEELSDGKVRFTGIEPKKNISLKGEDVRKGDVVIKRTRLIQPQDIAIMASVGHINVRVRQRPSVGIISTGDELVNPSEIPGISKIRNSNAYQLQAQIRRSGGEAIDYGIVPDSESITYVRIKNAIEKNSIVIITGGVSMGDFDFVPTVLARAGVKILFDKVNVQPGKPTTFGIHSKAVVFGLPGNPVSSFVQFEMLVRPFINRMMGYDWKPYEFKLPMAVGYERKSSTRLGFIPVSINEKNEVIPVDFHGSAHLTSLSVADGLIALKPGVNSLKKGEIVNVRQI
jgi:molybdopterin molybdotransferase